MGILDSYFDSFSETTSVLDSYFSDKDEERGERIRSLLLPEHGLATIGRQSIPELDYGGGFFEDIGDVIASTQGTGLAATELATAGLPRTGPIEDSLITMELPDADPYGSRDEIIAEAKREMDTWAALRPRPTSTGEKVAFDLAQGVASLTEAPYALFSAKGRYQGQELDSGRTYQESEAGGLAYGIGSMVLENLGLGALIGKLGGKATTRIGAAIMGEGVTEFSQSQLEDVVRAATTEEEYSFIDSFKKGGYEGFIGGLAGGSVRGGIEAGGAAIDIENLLRGKTDLGGFSGELDLSPEEVADIEGDRVLGREILHERAHGAADTAKSESLASDRSEFDAWMRHLIDDPATDLAATNRERAAQAEANLAKARAYLEANPGSILLDPQMVIRNALGDGVALDEGAVTEVLRELSETYRGEEAAGQRSAMFPWLPASATAPTPVSPASPPDTALPATDTTAERGILQSYLDEMADRADEAAAQAKKGVYDEAEGEGYVQRHAEEAAKILGEPIAELASDLGVTPGEVIGFVFDDIPQEFRPESLWDRAKGQFFDWMPEGTRRVFRRYGAEKGEAPDRNAREIQAWMEGKQAESQGRLKRDVAAMTTKLKQHAKDRDLSLASVEEMLRQYIVGEIDMPFGDGTPGFEVAAKIRSRIDDLSRLLMAAEQIGPKAARARIGEYIHRTYKLHQPQGRVSSSGIMVFTDPKAGEVIKERMKEAQSSGSWARVHDMLTENGYSPEEANRQIQIWLTPEEKEGSSSGVFGVDISPTLPRSTFVNNEVLTEILAERDFQLQDLNRNIAAMKDVPGSAEAIRLMEKEKASLAGIKRSPGTRSVVEGKLARDLLEKHRMRTRGVEPTMDEEWAKLYSEVMRDLELPEEVRELLGEITNPLANFAQTVAPLENMLNQKLAYQAIEEIGVAGGWLTADPEVSGLGPDGLPWKINAVNINGNQYSIAASALDWMHSVSGARASITKLLGTWVGGLAKLESTVKLAKTAGSVRSLERNLLSWGPTLLAWGHDPTPLAAMYLRVFSGGKIKGVPTIGKAIGLTNKGLNVSRLAADVTWKMFTLPEQWSANEEALADYLAANEITDTGDAYDLSKTLEQAQSMMRRGVDPVRDIVESQHFGKNALRKITSLGMGLWSLGDNLPRTYLFLSEVMREGVQHGFSKSEIEFAVNNWADTPSKKVSTLRSLVAAKIVHMAPTYSRLPLGVRLLRVVPFISDFPSFDTEAVRNFKNHNAYILHGNGVGSRPDWLPYVQDEDGSIIEPSNPKQKGALDALAFYTSRGVFGFYGGMVMAELAHKASGEDDWRMQFKNARETHRRLSSFIQDWAKNGEPFYLGTERTDGDVIVHWGDYSFMNQVGFPSRIGRAIGGQGDVIGEALGLPRNDSGDFLREVSRPYLEPSIGMTRVAEGLSGRKWWSSWGREGMPFISDDDPQAIYKGVKHALGAGVPTTITDVQKLAESLGYRGNPKDRDALIEFISMAFGARGFSTSLKRETGRIARSITSAKGRGSYIKRTVYSEDPNDVDVAFRRTVDQAREQFTDMMYFMDGSNKKKMNQMRDWIRASKAMSVTNFDIIMSGNYPTMPGEKKD